MSPKRDILKITGDLDELADIANAIIAEGNGYTSWLFEGDLGSGKTTLIKEICSRFGVKDNVSSPTFAIINEYSRSNGDPIYHFDFYRIKGIEEALDIGVDDYLFSGYICMIEWPRKVQELITGQYLQVEIRGNTDQNRTYLITKHG